MDEKRIPSGWLEISNLSLLSKVYNGLNGKSKDDFGFGKPYIPYTNVFNNSRIDISQIEYVNIKKGEKQNQLEFGDIIFTTSSETIEDVGMTSVYLEDKNDYFLNSFCFILRFNNKSILLPELLQYVFRSNESRYKLSLLGQGSTRYNLSKSRLLKEFNFIIPSTLEEQVKIYNILNQIDKSILYTKKIIHKYQCINSGLMQDLLTGGVYANKSLVKSDLKDLFISESFCQTKFEKISNVRQGYQIAISSRKKSYAENRYVYITVQYLNNPAKYLEYIENPPENVICTEEEILFTRTGNTGQIISGIKGVFHNNFFKISFDDKVIDRDYLIFYLNWEPVQNLIKELAGTTTIPDMKHKDFYKMPIFFPSTLEEQKEISRILKSSEKNILNYKKQLKKLNDLKQGLMQDLLSGKIRVNY